MTTRRPADVRRILDRDERFEVCVAAADAGGAVQAALREEPDIGPLDLCMPGNGMAAVWERGRLNVQVPERPISIGGYLPDMGERKLLWDKYHDILLRRLVVISDQLCGQMMR